MNIIFKPIVLILLAVINFGCQGSNTPMSSNEALGKGIENLVLGDIELVNFDLVNDIENEQGFSKDGDSNFYIPNKQLYAFDSKVVYVGLVGIEYVPGANITVEGNVKDVTKSIKSKIKSPLDCSSKGCTSQVAKNLKLLIYQHTDNEDWTIVHCGYFGP